MTSPPGPPPPPVWGPPPSGPPLYGEPLPAGRSNGYGVAALVLGILAVLLSWTVVVGVVAGVTAVVLGAVGRGRAARGEADNRGVAVAGVITGVLGLLLSAAAVAVYVFVGRHTDFFDCLDRAQTKAQRDQCVEQLRQDLRDEYGG